MTPADRRALRRQLGPVAWCALEDLLEEAQVDTLGRRVVSSSVRRLAENLGVSKDTTARALRRLAAGDLIAPLPAPRDDDGRFGGGAYVIRCTPSLDDTRLDRRDAAPAMVSARSRRQRVRTAGASQQSLFDAIPNDRRSAASACAQEAADTGTRMPRRRDDAARRVEHARRETTGPEAAATDRTADG